MRKFLSFFIGATVGGLVGAGAALLLAPASGQEVRAQMSGRFQMFASDIRQASNTKRIELQERLDTLRSPKS